METQLIHETNDKVDSQCSLEKKTKIICVGSKKVSH